MKRSRQHLLQQLERPRRHGRLSLIVAILGVLNIAASLATLLAIDPLF
jgi:hypothetical protein